MAVFQMYGAGAHGLHSNFSGTEVSEWNGVEGGSHDDASMVSFPSTSPLSPWLSAPSYNTALSFGPPAHCHTSHAGSMVLPEAFAQSILYQTHGSYRQAFEPQPGPSSNDLSRAQYGEPLNYPPQLATFEQRLDFFTDLSMQPKELARDPWVDFVRPSAPSLRPGESTEMCQERWRERAEP
ncbi:hypothetical protein B0H14DRAFT_115980 [Mycena olivaceomarginata]|nr:hypothetical protein B0H14DRAFT_115980 [Mycena olivaceomarginata]